MKIVIIALACLSAYTQAQQQHPDKKLPKGEAVASLPAGFTAYENTHDDSKIVANKEKAFIVNVAQGKGAVTQKINPFKIGDLLAYIYEILEWGIDGPPTGFTHDLFGYQVQRRKRSNVPFKRFKMTFTSKKNKKHHSEELNQKMEEEEQAKE